MSKVLLIEPDWQHRDKEVPEKFVVKIYYMKKFTDCNPLKGYIIMEYIENIVSIHFYEILTPAEVEQILRNKAVLEATSLKFTSEEKKQFTDSSFEGFYAEFLSREERGRNDCTRPATVEKSRRPMCSPAREELRKRLHRFEFKRSSVGLFLSVLCSVLSTEESKEAEAKRLLNL
nr:Uncharacterised kinase D1044.1 domain containing protein [Haemonchus contortus]